jgi:hypothetical protein
MLSEVSGRVEIVGGFEVVVSNDDEVDVVSGWLGSKLY